MDGRNLEHLLMYLGLLGEWALKNEMKINPDKSKAERFKRGRVKDPLN
jgi:hypothetical protein